jgi:hypothetical protein
MTAVLYFQYPGPGSRRVGLVVPEVSVEGVRWTYETMLRDILGNSRPVPDPTRGTWYCEVTS